MGASARHLDKTGGTIISARSWLDLISGSLSTADKFWLQNDGDRDLASVQLAIQQISGNDGATFARLGLDVGSISPPFGVAAVVETGSAGWGGTGENRYVVTAKTALGESTRSLQEVSASIVAATNQVRVTWLKPPGAALTGYRVYRTRRLGVVQTAQRIADLSDPETLEVVDDALVGSPATAPPSTNTTGGDAPDYGSTPSLGTGTITLGTMKPGQAVAYWVNWLVPEATSETGNPRQFRLRPTETL